VHALVPRSVRRSVVVREGEIISHGNTYYLPKLTLDTGASSGNYIGAALLRQLPGVTLQPCRHRALLADGKTCVNVTNMVTLEIRLYDDLGDLSAPVSTDLYVIESLGEQIIVGLPAILGEYFDFFSAVLNRGRKSVPVRQEQVHRLQHIGDLICAEVMSRTPRPGKLRRLRRELSHHLHKYTEQKLNVLADPCSTQVLHNNGSGSTVEVIRSRKYGSVYSDSRVEELCHSLCNLTEVVTTAQPGDIIEPWALDLDPIADEEAWTPDPLSFPEAILHFMEVSPDEARREYLDEVVTHVSADMAAACPQVLDLLRSPVALDVFAPMEWNGLDVAPATFTVRGQLPARLTPKARPIRPSLYDSAAKEFARLRKYFYTDSESPVASPLVIAPKATAPFIRFCGDYREVNKYIDIPQQPIPIVKHELLKAAKHKVFVDLDMANSFHQIPLSPEFSDLLSVQTPWGLYRPRFLPEGVGPASGLLQHLVREIFADFADWTIVIFDNFLILADDYADAYAKLERVLQRCHEKRIVLKLKKSWVGVDTVTFFGYEVTNGTWRLSESRKAAISAMSMPTSTKEMQSFLGAALFFHNHVPDYTEWSARLYEMTHATFVWDPGTWTYDYEAHFARFKEALCRATELYLPDYSLPWIVRCDASKYGVGAVLFQEATDSSGAVVHQPIAFSSRKFSGPAQNWDTYKREAFAVYHAIDSFAYYLRGKHFLLETDHRNLVWIEASVAPIVVRWRALLQSYSFLIRHIPGRDNTVADWLSRMGSPSGETGPGAHNGATPTLSTIDSNKDEESNLDYMLRQVHGGRSLHFGAAETWRRAKQLFPRAHIPIDAVRSWVKECPMCQKVRRAGLPGLPAVTLSLKPPTYRSAVGIDHITVTPPDAAGNKCVLLIVEHFAHFPQAYAAQDYTAETVARTLFKHFCVFGMFDVLCSDPGSAFMSEVIAQLNSWLGVRHKVSLVGRHQSNGCEGSVKQFVRHLKALVSDERLREKWSDDTVLPLINFEMCSYPTTETGGYTPFELKYGSRDARYFRLPDSCDPQNRPSQLIQQLDRNIQDVRDASHKLQQQLAASRAAKDKAYTAYEAGDYILFNPREKPADHLPHKLDPDWLGPYEVISQNKNDITCKHVVLHSIHTFHVSRVKPFFGSRDDAYKCAKLDQNQFFIRSIDRYTGNPRVRTSLVFTVTFEDGEALVPWSKDIAETQQMEAFIFTRPELFPLQFSAEEASKRIRQMNQLAITSVQPGDVIYLHLRYFDGDDRAWYDSLKLPVHREYVVQVRVERFTDRRQRQVLVYCETFDDRYALTAYDIMAYTLRSHVDSSRYEVITRGHENIYPQVFI
jgi:RNase H-like domain found in reverse transcriptase